ncbi:MAG TPA: carboxylating nicotinate-nucleotide diphosphorylase [Candidatus Eisenbacteria bacterium]|jgi:nicotinate-nucleotide pyrophosphorylase (carboxylating)|nr:carboxylating nicotinate-nucleotide diphosphorylase [Candidatus Eisenbacteria bacterium]
MRLEAFALPLVRLALTEDLGGGDVTTDGVVDEGAAGRAHIEARHDGVLAGRELAELTFRELDPEAKVEWSVAEGGALTKGAKFATITARARAILSGERVALNFLQHLSGVATLARAYAKAVEGTGVTILDTRKTTPGLRFLEKHAVRVGGAGNHRFGLFDGVLIKENHIRAAGSMKAAFEKTRAGAEGLPTVIEAKSPEDALDAADLHPTRVLLDNFTPTAIAATVKRLKGSKVEVEVSGGIRLANVRDFAIPGVNYISVGSITHSAPALDMSLLMDEVKAGA